MTLSAGSFAQDSLEHEASQQGLPVSVLLRHAVYWYLAEFDSARQAVRVPRFAREYDGDGGTGYLLDLEEPEWEALERAAAAEEVALPELIEHAAMLYLADLDSGEVARRILG